MLTHGKLSETSGLGPLDIVSGEEDILLLQTACEGISQDQLPWKRCGFKTGHIYSYPDILLVSCLVLAPMEVCHTWKPYLWLADPSSSFSHS